MCVCVYRWGCVYLCVGGRCVGVAERESVCSRCVCMCVRFGVLDTAVHVRVCTRVHMRVCVCVRVCVCLSAHACVCLCLSVCVSVCV